jgi:hypothetical protein
MFGSRRYVSSVHELQWEKIKPNKKTGTFLCVCTQRASPRHSTEDLMSWMGKSAVLILFLNAWLQLCGENLFNKSLSHSMKEYNTNLVCKQMFLSPLVPPVCLHEETARQRSPTRDRLSNEN